jgi:CRP-like cAMP-binding protein
VSAGEVLVREGAAGGQSFTSSPVARATIDGRHVAFLGDFFGELAILDPGLPRAATVTAVTAMRLLVLEPRSFSTLLTLLCVAGTVILGIVQRLR